MRPTVLARCALLVLALSPVVLRAATARRRSSRRTGGDPERGRSSSCTIGPGEALRRCAPIRCDEGGRTRTAASRSPTSARSPTSSSPTRSRRRGWSSSTRIRAARAPAAWRPQEALPPRGRAVGPADEQFAGASPVAEGDGSARRWQRAADRRPRRQHAAQRDRVGGEAARGRHARPEQRHRRPDGQLVPAAARRSATPRGNYTGVQDYDDYSGNRPSTTRNVPRGQFAGWPAYPGLMDRAQQPFEAEGLAVPSYIGLGNHDGLVQGNGTRNARSRSRDRMHQADRLPATDRPRSSARTRPALRHSTRQVILVPPDQPPVRRQGAVPRSTRPAAANGHGFGTSIRPSRRLERRPALLLVQPEAGHPLHRARLAVARRARRPVAAPTHGNIDDPQFQWLKQRARRRRGRQRARHHSSRTTRRGSMTFSLPDERHPPAPATTPRARHQPGLRQGPAQLAADPPRNRFRKLLRQYPNVIAEVAGHSHNNRVDAHPGANQTASGRSRARRSPTGRPRAACSTSWTTTTGRSRSSARC